jgi:hypothetical protein
MAHMYSVTCWEGCTGQLLQTGKPTCLLSQLTVSCVQLQAAAWKLQMHGMQAAQMLTAEACPAPHASLMLEVVVCLVCCRTQTLKLPGGTPYEVQVRGCVNWCMCR